MIILKDKKEMKKIGLVLIIFSLISLGVSHFMNTKIDALEKDKESLIESNAQYKGDCYDKDMDFDDDVVIKIIDEIDSSVDINFINKFDKVDENNKKYYSIELNISGDLDKINSIETALSDLNLNYKIDKIDINKPKSRDGSDKDYVDCFMIFNVN